MMLLLASGGTGAINAVLLASAVVPPLIAIFLARILWLWARSDDENRHSSVRELVKQAVGMGAHKPRHE
jgi:hypothetical protein